MGTKLTSSEIELIVSLYEPSNRNSREAERMLKREPYFSQDLDFSFQTILNYWKAEGFEIRSRGGRVR